MRTWRSRIVVIATLLCAGAFFAFELPIRELIHQRSEISITSSELQTLNGQNADLSSTITSLRHDGVVSSIAHADYGLIFSGQQSFVVLPGKSQGSHSQNTLGAKPIAAENLVPGDVSSLTPHHHATAKSASAPQGSLGSRTLSKLEFWRWAF